MTNKILRKLNYWQKALGLENYRVVIEKHHKEQVTFEYGKVGGNAVGSSFDEENGIITIFTTRSLREDDVVHELLHTKYPQFTHDEIVTETESLIVSRDSNYLEGSHYLLSVERAF